MKILKKNNFYITLFIIVSLAALLLMVIFYSFCNLSYRQKQAALPREQDRYYLNYNYQDKDPLITRNPGLADMLSGPIISERDPGQGEISAPITIVQFSDFVCEFCAEQEQVLRSMALKYKDSVRLIWKDYPENNVESESYQAALAARCAQRQGLFWPYHDLLFAQKKFDYQNLLLVAKEAQLDINKFEECLAGEFTRPLIEENMQEANALDINGVPFVYINDQEVLGEISAEDLEKIILLELEKISQ